MSRAKVHVKKGDQVVVITGKDAGKVAKIVQVMPKESKVIVEGVNVVKRHTKPSQANPQGGIIEKEAPIHSSNVLLYCSKCNQGVRSGKQINDGDNKNKVRCCKKCGQILD